MRNPKPYVWLLTALALLPCASLGIDMDSVARSIDGFVSIEAGRVEKGFYNNYTNGGDVTRQWLSTTKVNAGITWPFARLFRASAGVEGTMWVTSYPIRLQISTSQWNAPSTSFDFYLDKAEIAFNLGDPERLSLGMEAGYFPYKYNPDSRNLGEYLFRSGTYPAYLLSEFDYAKTRLLGLRISGAALGRIYPDILVTFENKVQPFYDVSITPMLTARVVDAVEIGVAAQFSRIFSADWGLTTARDGRTVYDIDSTATPPDTLRYTLSGTKLMARLSVDPKRLFGFDAPSGRTAFFKEDDGKLYAEWAFLGVKDYPSTPDGNPYGYDVAHEKMPVMMGVNVPTHPFVTYGALALLGVTSRYVGFLKDDLGISIYPAVTAVFPVAGFGTWALKKFLDIDAGFDVVAWEAQWYGCRYANSYFEVATKRLALPSDMRKSQGIADSTTYSPVDDWKWSMYFTKALGSRVNLTAQAARDHLRLPVKAVEDSDREEVMSLPAHWYWMLKVSVGL